MKTDAGQEVFRTGLAAGAGSLRLSYDDDAMTVGRVEVLGEALGTLAGADLARVAADSAGVAEGTLIATERGEVRAEALRPGDRVVTREAGLQPVFGVVTLDIGWRQLGLLPVLRPIRIASGAFGEAGPIRDLLVAGGLGILPAGRGESATAARALLGEPGVAEADVTAIRYVRLTLRRSGAILANGLWVEGVCGPDSATAAGRPVAIAEAALGSEN